MSFCIAELGGIDYILYVNKKSLELETSPLGLVQTFDFHRSWNCVRQLSIPPGNKVRFLPTHRTRPALMRAHSYVLSFYPIHASGCSFSSGVSLFIDCCVTEQY